MANEEIKTGEGSPAPASGEEKPKETEKESETVDYKAEAEKEKNLREEKERTLAKAENRIIKLKNKLDEAGIPEEEPSGGVSEETLRNVVKEVVGEAIKPIREELYATKAERDEAIRAANAKANAGEGGGEGGQKPPIVAQQPELSPQDKVLVEKYGLKWDADKENPDTGKKGVWVSNDGKVYPMTYARPLK